MRWSSLLFVVLFAMPWHASHAATIYLCKSYGGGLFWSADHCRKQSAVMEREVSVPDGMAWADQVQLGEQARANAAALVAPPPVPVQQQQQQRPQQQQSKQAECQWLDARIANLDANARQPQSGRTGCCARRAWFARGFRGGL